MKTRLTLPLINHAALLVLLSALNPHLSSLAQGTAFTYQGRLNENGVPLNRTYDLLFRPFNVPTGGTQLQIPNLRTVTMTNGLFTTTLDFGSTIFNGDPLWLQIEVSTNGFSGIVAALAPRQQITPAPYATFAAGLANGAVDTPQLAAGAVTASKIASNAVTNAKIDNAAVDTPQLVGGAVTSAKVADGTLLPADLNLGNFERTFWKVGGNSGTSADFIGTTDGQPFDVRVNNTRVMRYRLTTDGTGNFTNAPNVIGGSPVNSALTTIVGATIGGGGGNISFDGGELDNRTTANFATVSGGAGNLAGGDYATVGGGYVATAGGNYATVSGGYNNSASGNHAAVPGGRQNSAQGNYSFAAGRRAKAVHQGSFVWADSRDVDFPSVFPDGFFVRCDGATIATGINGSGEVTSGVHLFRDATSWSSVSDRNAKKNLSPVNAEAVLEKLASLPVQSWNYKWESDTNTPHLGPMAQDFKAAFYPGRDDKSISTLEFDGVELAAIQGLNQKLTDELKRRDAENAELKSRLSALEGLVAKLNQKAN
jgi:hypothetical protein